MNSVKDFLKHAIIKIWKSIFSRKFFAFAVTVTLLWYNKVSENAFIWVAGIFIFGIVVEKGVEKWKR